MNQIWVSDRDGWLHAFAISRTLMHIGSDERCDIVLDAKRGGGVSSRHLQLVLPGNGKPGKFINLGDSEVRTARDQVTFKVIAPRASAELAEGQILHVGDFTIWFDDKMPINPGQPIVPAAPQTSIQRPALSAPQTRTPVQSMLTGTTTALIDPLMGTPPASASSIATRINLPSRSLSPSRPLEGGLVIRNTGTKTGAQFRIELNGLQPQCFELGAGPVLFPSAEREVPLRILHPGTSVLMAGQQQFTIRVTSPVAYPGEVATVTHVVQVDPVYRHRIEILQ